MEATATAGARALADRLGISDDQIVQEVGWDSDVPEDLRLAIEETTGAPLEDESYTGPVDVCLLWFRAGDGDLTDDCVDALGGLEDDGFVLLVTPNLKHELHVDQADVDDAAKTAGLQPQSSVQIDDVWLATKLGRPTRRRG
ncbi:DUF3052 domain-containing protein [Kytococcus sedentarius]|uniref:DUF3052 domain-containing protein n=1 Tax=Kytococcus sedentarius (strain ATCC 14392 / DSM 20547 / JCM 11482 / CCUG 33030 / NBRC 15357 / NCTC 11040 / CCM 314 / 541) TaxID=478801 RepID=C7NH87_KYTSD|nr:DUF3052 domain-containing protein [Kytococcus sedentarius]ACV06244.1 hypothetical protein Ksed_12070 [Kytococcus sedentarius DSM 20547]OLT38382.1 hypothetical protein BJF82_08690 [Kytococcus sp. CUA-901]QQB64587.1 DUF3052 domain-containing protein [Kytococcus sedentarius]STX12335.1 Protein of uncharacterised function (DUF3052) [Kytococcus sedentarius]